MKTILTNLAASLALLATTLRPVVAQNMLRFACSQLVVERTDPIVFPGSLFTPHIHQIVGGNSFNTTMSPDDHDPSTLSTCTSCNFAQDKSNYWTAVMFFKARNGSYHRVPQVGNGGPQGALVCFVLFLAAACHFLGLFSSTDSAHVDSEWRTGCLLHP